MAMWGRILSRGTVEDRRGFGPTGIGGLGLGGVVLALLVTYLSQGSISPGEVITQHWI
jgi:hypothetical protein